MYLSLWVKKKRKTVLVQQNIRTFQSGNRKLGGSA